MFRISHSFPYRIKALCKRTRVELVIYFRFVKQHHLTVLNLDLKPIFLRSIFYRLYLSLFYSHGNVFLFSLKYMIVKRY